MQVTLHVFVPFSSLLVCNVINVAFNATLRTLKESVNEKLSNINYAKGNSHQDEYMKRFIVHCNYHLPSFFLLECLNKVRKELSDQKY